MQEKSFKLEFASTFIVELFRSLYKSPESLLIYNMYGHAFFDAFEPYMTKPTLDSMREYGKPDVTYFRDGIEYALNEARLEARYFLLNETFWIEHTMLEVECAIKMIRKDLERYDAWVEKQIDSGVDMRLYSEKRWLEAMD